MIAMKSKANNANTSQQPDLEIVEMVDLTELNDVQMAPVEEMKAAVDVDEPVEVGNGRGT